MTRTRALAVLSLILAAASPSLAQSWTNEGVGTPGERYLHMLSWDPVNGRLLLFGGEDDTLTFKSGLWAWNPASHSWSSVTTSGTPPSARGYTQFTWDASRKRQMFYGGFGLLGTSVTALSDVWALNVTTNTWSLLPQGAGGPVGGRDGVGCVYDAGSDSMFVIGGFDAGFGLHGDVNAYNVATGAWTAKASVPVAIGFFAADIDPVARKIYVFGGYSGAPYSGNLYIYDIATNLWSVSTAPGAPGNRGYCAGVWNPVNQRFMVFGGYDSAVRNDLREYDPAANAWTVAVAPSAPGARSCTSGAFDPATSRFYIYAGSLDTFLGPDAPAELWHYTVPAPVPAGGSGGVRGGGHHDKYECWGAAGGTSGALILLAILSALAVALRR